MIFDRFVQDDAEQGALGQWSDLSDKDLGHIWFRTELNRWRPAYGSST